MIRFLTLLAVLSLAIPSLKAQSVPLLRLQSGDYPLPVFRGKRVAWPEAPEGADRSWGWLQFTRALRSSEIHALQESGISLLGYVDDHAYYVSIPAALPGDFLRSLPLHAIHAFMPEHRLHPDLLPWLNGSGKDAGKCRIQLAFHEGLPVASGLSALHKAGFRTAKWQEGTGWVHLTLQSSDLLRLAALPCIRYIEPLPPAGEPEDRNGRAMHRSNLVLRSEIYPGLRLDGSGVRMLIRDDGRIGPHIDYQGRLNQDYCIRSETHGDHGDMVAGIAAGANNLNPAVAGMASGAMIYTEDYDGDFPAYTEDLITQESITLTNSSYSDGCNEGYTLRSERVDRQIWENAALMHVFSAGNAGTSDCDYGAGPFWGNVTGGHKAGKNAIATANLYSNLTIVPSSSRGPVHDGRLKPDISAHGQNQLSTYPNHTINLGGGTSAAAPGIAGVLAQLSQGYLEKSGEISAPAALLKSILLNTATDLGQPGPDFIFGWGHVNAWEAWKSIEAGQFTEIQVPPGEVMTLDIEVPSGLAEARFMLYWPDPPAMPQAAKALLQDFDLTVIPPGGGQPLLPLVLNSTPDPALLNQPAQPGEDHVNNVEQVRIANPIAGTYQVEVRGTNLPFGDAGAWLTHAFFTGKPYLVFPAGGEAFAPGEEITLYWEASSSTEPWQIEFSSDNGQNWEMLADSIAGSARHQILEVPEVATKEAWFRLIQGADTLLPDHPLTIFPLPTALRVTRACPDSVFLAWDPSEGATSWFVHQLGDRYMEITATVDTAAFGMATWNPLADNWIALQSRGADDIVSPRTIAQNLRTGLIQCRQEFDTRVAGILSPIQLELTACEPAPLVFTLSVRNDGMQPVENVPISYQVGQSAPVSEIITGTINPGGVRFYKFITPPLFTESGSIPIAFWTDLDNDQFRYNDTIYARVEVTIRTTGVLQPDVMEDFEAALDLPVDWSLRSSNNDWTWTVFRIPQEGGDSTNALVMPNFFYDQIGEQDVVVSPQIDLTLAGQPRMGFDLAYNGIFGQAPDTLIIEVATDCEEDNAEQVLQLTGTPLITAVDPFGNNGPYVPVNPEDWRYEEIDLSPWAGKKVLVLIRNHAGYGNNLWLDNIRLVDDAPVGVTAGMAADRLYACVGQLIQFADDSEGIPDAWSWDFGAGADPPMATGPGPHAVTYSAPGLVQVTLVASRGMLTDTVVRSWEVRDIPVAGFSAEVVGDSLYLTNESLGGESWIWMTDLPSGSTDASPVFPLNGLTEGSITITLVALNGCGADTLATVVQLTSVDGYRGMAEGWTLYPNPAGERFWLKGLSEGGPLWWELVAVDGRVVAGGVVETVRGPVDVLLAPAGVAAGTYGLRLKQSSRYGTVVFRKE